MEGITAFGVLCKKESDAKPLIRELRKWNFECKESSALTRDIEILIPKELAGDRRNLMAKLLETGKVIEVTCMDSNDVIMMNRVHSFSLGLWIESCLKRE